MDNKLDISVKIWSDFYNRADTTLAEVKLMREANDLCKCFGIPKEVSEIGKRIASEGDKNVNDSKK